MSFPEFKKEMGYGPSREPAGSKRKARPKSAAAPMGGRLRNSKKKKVRQTPQQDDDFSGEPLSKTSSRQQSFANLTEIDRQFEMQQVVRQAPMQG